jgi:hypothetical protein
MHRVDSERLAAAHGHIRNYASRWAKSCKPQVVTGRTNQARNLVRLEDALHFLRRDLIDHVSTVSDDLAAVPRPLRSIGAG